MSVCRLVSVGDSSGHRVEHCTHSRDCCRILSLLDLVALYHILFKI